MLEMIIEVKLLTAAAVLAYLCVFYLYWANTGCIDTLYCVYWTCVEACI
jgi:hypothetical protein